MGEAGDMYKSISMLNYCYGPYVPLPCCENKIRSAWTKVWTGPCRSRASIMTPGGRDLDLPE